MKRRTAGDFRLHVGDYYGDEVGSTKHGLLRGCGMSYMYLDGGAKVRDCNRGGAGV